MFLDNGKCGCYDIADYILEREAKLKADHESELKRAYKRGQKDLRNAVYEALAVELELKANKEE